MAGVRLFLCSVVIVLAALTPSSVSGQEPAKKKTIVMLVYPEFTALDLVGPHHVFSALQGYEVKLVWKSTDLVKSDTGLTFKPDLSFKDCPDKIAILFVPGGTRGTVKAMEDPEVLAFLKSRGEKAEYVTSVCTGSLVLGASGLLKGYKATTHWGAIDILTDLGATPTRERVVIDRNRVTGGGVTAGIDFGLLLASKLKGEEYAKWIQLIMEYSPAPPFKSGTPTEAGPEMTKMTEQMFTSRPVKCTWVYQLFGMESRRGSASRLLPAVGE